MRVEIPGGVVKQMIDAMHARRLPEFVDAVGDESRIIDLRGVRSFDSVTKIRAGEWFALSVSEWKKCLVLAMEYGWRPKLAPIHYVNSVDVFLPLRDAEALREAYIRWYTDFCNSGCHDGTGDCPVFDAAYRFLAYCRYPLEISNRKAP